MGADIVELNPDEDIREMTATVAAKFAKEFIARMYTDTQRKCAMKLSDQAGRSDGTFSKVLRAAFEPICMAFLET